MRATIYGVLLFGILIITMAITDPGPKSGGIGDSLLDAQRQAELRHPPEDPWKWGEKPQWKIDEERRFDGIGRDLLLIGGVALLGLGIVKLGSRE